MNIYAEYGNIMPVSFSRGHRKKVSTDPGVSKFGLWRTLDYQCTSARARRFWECPPYVDITFVWLLVLQVGIYFLPDGACPLPTTQAEGWHSHPITTYGYQAILGSYTGPYGSWLYTIAIRLKQQERLYRICFHYPFRTLLLSHRYPRRECYFLRNISQLRGMWQILYKCDAHSFLRYKPLYYPPYKSSVHVAMYLLAVTSSRVNFSV